MQSTQHVGKASVISIVGAKEGVGTSTVALNCAFSAAKDGHRVLLFDFDLHCQGDLESMVDGTWKDMTDLTSLKTREVPPDLIKDYLTHHDSGVSYLRAMPRTGMDQCEHLAPTQVAEMMAYLARAFDRIVVDCGAVCTPAHSPILIGSGRILVVTRGVAHYLKHASRKYELLAMGYIPADKIRFVVNRWKDDGRVPKSLITDHLPAGGCYFLNEDNPGMERAYEKAGPAVLHSPKGNFARSLGACVSDGLLESPARPFPLGDALGANADNFMETWMRPMVGSSVPEEVAHHPETRVSEAEESVYEEPEVDDAWIELKKKILGELFKTIDLKQVGIVTREKDRTKLNKSTTEAILKIINEIGEETIPQGKREHLVEEVLHEALGLGPLEALMADRTISEIMVNGKDQIYIERDGKLKLSSLKFSTEKQLFRIIERIVSPIGRRVDESTPLVDARLADGSRVNIIIPPLALKGPTVTIRRFSEDPFQVEDLIRFGALTEPMAKFLRACIEAKLNIIVSGGTGSGKTTLLNVLSSFIPEGDRIVTIEDAAELKLYQPHVVTLEARPPNLEGKGAITIRDLVKNALRMRPDRIVVGECRGGEALDMLQAMNTGHDGSMTTVHANSAKDAISRLETLVLFSGIELPSRAIREQIVGGIHLIIQLSRYSDGTRKISDIAEMTGMEGNVVTLQSIFRFQQRGIGENKKIIGDFEPTGIVPKFFDELLQKGMKLSRDIFVPKG